MVSVGKAVVSTLAKELGKKGSLIREKINCLGSLVGGWEERGKEKG